MTSVKEILPVALKRLITIREDELLTKAASFLDGGHINLVVVCNNSGAMVGIITRTDIVRQISLCQGCGCKAAVGSVMTRDVISCRPGDSLQDVWSIMREKKFLHVPIVNDDLKPLGVINERDALRLLLEGVEYEEALLRDYVMGVGYR